MFQNAYAVVGDAVKQQHPRTVWLRGSDFPAPKQNSIRSVNVKRFLVNADLLKGSIGLLHQVRRKGAPDGMQEGRSDEPADHDRGKHRKKQQNDEDSHDSSGHGLFWMYENPIAFVPRMPHGVCRGCGALSFGFVLPSSYPAHTRSDE
jgi:hypothetical protein